MSVVRSYTKTPPLGDFNSWVEREFEAVERGIEDAAYGLRWDDLRFPASAINPAGSTAPASVDTDDGSLSFAGNSDQICAGIAQMPHAWKQESPIHPHLHLLFKTSASANTRWKLEYRIANVGDNFPAGWSSDTITVANQQNTLKHHLASFAEIAMTGYRWSAIILWRVTRLASSDGADNDTNAANLLEFDIHYQSDGRGSVPEYPT